LDEYTGFIKVNEREAVWMNKLVLLRLEKGRLVG